MAKHQQDNALIRSEMNKDNGRAKEQNSNPEICAESGAKGKKRKRKKQIVENN